MRYILGIVCLLVVVCAIGLFFVEEGFDNVGGKTPADYYGSIAAQMGPGYVPPATTGATVTNDPSQLDQSYYNYLKEKLDKMNIKMPSDATTGTKTTATTAATTAAAPGTAATTAAAPGTAATPSLSPEVLAILAELAKASATPTVSSSASDAGSQSSSATSTSNAKSVPDGSSSDQSSPGSAEQTSATNTPALTQGQAFTISVIPGTAPTSSVTNVSSLLPSCSSSESDSSDDCEGNVAVKVNKKPSKQCPDMSQYVRKDSIPCWGCKL